MHSRDLDLATPADRRLAIGLVYVMTQIDAYQRRNRSAPLSPPGEHRPQAVSPGAVPKPIREDV